MSGWHWEFDDNAISALCCPDFTKRVCFGCRYAVRIRLYTLAMNLTTAAALCRAYALGDNPPHISPPRHGSSLGVTWSERNLWYPGCGKEAPP